jgi:hypothetical protein
MSVVSVYCFVETEDKKELINRAKSFLENWLGNEFYDGFRVQEDGVLPYLSDLPSDYLEKECSRSQNLIQHLREKAAEMREAEDRLGEARAMRRASDLLYENLCPDMPWFNIESADFSIPSDPLRWGAVMVDFYY